ncbi:GGDEF domain-containing protein [Eubacteriales bacterium OttesenSCG-928-N14]|nr:GGDEF domain-containing protein [Eubacteriales bacterium OttesenSCG-928-N14]
MGLYQRFKQGLNTWDEICVDEGARLRTNTILCTFIVTIFFTLMLAVDLLTTRTLLLIIPAAFLEAISITLFVLQFRDRTYRPLISWLFGVMAWGMSIYLIYTGGMEGYSYLWVFLVPNIAIMVVNVKSSIIYNGILLAIIVAMMTPPINGLLQLQYTTSFRILYPIAILFVTMCAYIAEMVRYNTQKRLVDTAQQLQAFAYYDPLTGVYNRHALLSHFGDVKNDAAGLSFGMLDLDFFKQINDQYGHMVGDAMLKHIVQQVQQNLPANALLYRWGGEEFLIVLKTTELQAVSQILQNICHCVASRPLQERDNTIPITVSVGAFIAQQCCSIQQAITYADEALYAAKQQGRNRMVMA